MAAILRTVQLRKVYPAPRRRRRWRVPAGAAEATAAADAARPGPDGEVAAATGGIVALEGLDLEVEEGELFGLLGPNGAGKTTTIGILTTRVRPTSGRAFVAGADVVREQVAARQSLGVVPQRPNPDRSLRARENLVFHAAYFGVPWSLAARRADELMERLGIAGKADSRVDELSGGQQQRLMIARALIHEPRVLFLDEPTVGLDPQTRLALWEILRELHQEGRTIVLTTHYMEEADRLCERLAIIDRGRLLALDTPAVLKARAPGGTLVELELDGDASVALEAARRLAGVLRAEASDGTLRAYAERGGELIPPLIRAAEGVGRAIVNIHLAPPSLETLFLALTGRKLE